MEEQLMNTESIKDKIRSIFVQASIDGDSQKFERDLDLILQSYKQAVIEEEIEKSIKKLGSPNYCKNRYEVYPKNGEFYMIHKIIKEEFLFKDILRSNP